METLFMGGLDPLASTTVSQLASDPKFWLVAVLIVWSLVWKGIALWKAARLSHKKWFVLFLVINTVGILEIIYVYFIAGKYKVETLDKE